MAKVGYARVSSRGQSLGVQRDRLSDCDRMYNEKASGTTDKRPELQRCLGYLREGDTLVVTKLDRLARSTLHLCQIVDSLQSKGVGLKVLDQDIDTTTPTGRLLFGVLSVIAQFETEIRAERQAEGIARARERGVKFGTKKVLSLDEVRDLRRKRAEGKLIRELVDEYRISKVSVYRYLRKDYVEELK